MKTDVDFMGIFVHIDINNEFYFVAAISDEMFFWTSGTLCLARLYSNISE